MGRVVCTQTLPLQGGEVVSDRPLAQVKALQSSSKKENNGGEEVKTKC